MVHIQLHLAMLTVAIALLGYLHQPPDAAPLDWNQSVLPFSVPDIPALFYNDTLPLPRIPMTNFCGEHRYDSGIELFVSNYRWGWFKAVKDFIERKPVRIGEITVVNLIDRATVEHREADDYDSLPKTHWSEQHISFAFRNGYNDTTRQLNELATEIGEIDLRKTLLKPTPRYYFYKLLLLHSATRVNMLIRRFIHNFE